MAFNGTKHFPGRKGITNMLEKHGVEFGRNVNAYTAQDETVYNISEVPTTNPDLLDTCLLVLHDWSHFLLLVDDEIDGERGVISEEWRTRRTPSFRIRAQITVSYTHLYLHQYHIPCQTHKNKESLSPKDDNRNESFLLS